MDISKNVGGVLYACSDANDVASGLDTVWRGRRNPDIAVDRAILSQYSWNAQGEALTGVFAQAIEHSHRK